MTLGLLGAAGWMVRPEVSYSEWGERGSIDLLGWHASTRSLLIVEVKSELASVEETLRKHDEKVRLGSVVASRRLGWSPLTVEPSPGPSRHEDDQPTPGRRAGRARLGLPDP